MELFEPVMGWGSEIAAGVTTAVLTKLALDRLPPRDDPDSNKKNLSYRTLLLSRSAAATTGRVALGAPVLPHSHCILLVLELPPAALYGLRSS